MNKRRFSNDDLDATRTACTLYFQQRGKAPRSLRRRCIRRYTSHAHDRSALWLRPEVYTSMPSVERSWPVRCRDTWSKMQHPSRIFTKLAYFHRQHPLLLT